MISQPCQISRHATPLPCHHHSIATARRHSTHSAPSLHSNPLSITSRQSITSTQATFFEGLFQTSNKSDKKTGASERATALVSELFELLGPKRSKPKTGEDDVIKEIVDELTRLKLTKNPTRSAFFSGSWSLRYVGTTFKVVPSNVVMNTEKEDEVIYTANYPFFIFFEATNTVISPLLNKGPNTFEVSYERLTVDKGFFGKEEVNTGYRVRLTIEHLDERCIILARQGLEEGKPDTEPVIQIYERRMPRTSPVPLEDGVKSDISVGGVSKVARKTGAATKAEKSYRKQQKGTVKIDKAVEKDAAFQLKSKIKASVDGYGSRLKEVQEKKKEAAAALREFQKENGGQLKELAAFKKQMDGFESEIESLKQEIADETALQKESGLEIRDCRTQLTALERTLASF